MDESYLGTSDEICRMLRGPLPKALFCGKSAVVGAKDQETNQVTGRVVPSTDKKRLRACSQAHVKTSANIYTDNASASEQMIGFNHDSVKHSISEYVKEPVHTNGLESFWAMLKRLRKSTFHKISIKHLQRHVNEFAGRYNVRPFSNLEQMFLLFECMEQRKLLSGFSGTGIVL